MYSKLIVHHNPLGTIDEIEARLHELGHIEWVGLTPEEEKLFRESKDINTFLRILMYFNYRHVGKRFSNRYQRFVNFGNAGQNRGSNRSIIDMFLIAKHYAPQFANFRMLYNGLMQWYCTDRDFRQQICSTIHRRVWFFQGTRSLENFLNSKSECSVKLRLDYENNELRKKDELGTKIHIDTNSDPVYRMEYVEQNPLVIPNGTIGIINAEKSVSSLFIKSEGRNRMAV